jgi:hypothetical protein
MIIQYNLPIKNTVITTKVRPAMARAEADFYLNKNSEWLLADCELVSNNLNATPYIFSKKTFKNKTVVQTNTTALLLSNIVIEGIPYYYKLVATGNYDLNFVKSATNCYDIVEFEGQFYSNSKIFYRFSSDSVVYTDYVINPQECSITYTAKFITIEAPYTNCNVKLPETIFEPLVISEYCVSLPNFYLTDTTTNKLLRFIREESIHDFYEVVGNSGMDYQACKKIFQSGFYKYSACLNRLINEGGGTIYSSGVDQYIYYTALTTSHDYIFDDELLIKFTPTGLEVNPNNFDLKIRLKVDINKVDITINNHKPLNRVYNYKSSNIVNRLVNTGVGVNTGLKTVRDLNLERHPNRYNYIDNLYITTNDVVLNESLRYKYATYKQQVSHHVIDDIGKDSADGPPVYPSNNGYTRIASERYNVYREINYNGQY